MTDSKNMTPEQVQRKIILVQLLGTPGAIMVGLALYGIFATDGDAFWAPLNNTFVTYNMLGIGGIIVAWETIQTLKLSKLQKTLSERDST